MKTELCGKIIKKYLGLRAKHYSYLTDDDSENIEAKGTKNVIKRKRNSEDYKTH